MTALQLNPETGDLLIEQNSLTLGNTREQNAQLIISASRGEFKEHPTLGVGIARFLHSVGKEQELTRDIKVALALDGIINPKIEFTSNQINITLCEQ